jgi:hypothetical protein
MCVKRRRQGGTEKERQRQRESGRPKGSAIVCARLGSARACVRACVCMRARGWGVCCFVRVCAYARVCDCERKETEERDCVWHKKKEKERLCVSQRE